MRKQKIIRLGTDGDNYLGYMEEEIYEPIMDEDPILTLEELADLCDQEAESRNNHNYVGLHKLVATLLFKQLGREKATKIMQEIAEYKGLDGMKGLVYQTPSAFSDFGLKDDWTEWELSETNV